MSTNHDSGKSDAPKPFSVNLEKFSENFDLIFGKKEKQTEPIPFAGMVDIGESEDEQD